MVAWARGTYRNLTYRNLAKRERWVATEPSGSPEPKRKPRHLRREVTRQHESPQSP